MPSGHAKQAEAPVSRSLYRPAAHTVQASMEVAAVRVLYVPDLHAVHVALSAAPVAAL